MALTTIPSELSSVSGIADSSDATAITIDSSENVTFAGNILKTGSLTVDVSGTLILDSDDGDLQLKDGGTQFASLYKSSNDFIVRSMISDGDFKIQGNDGGSTINALTIDMSEGGAATFNGELIAPNGATEGYHIKQTGGTATPRITNDGNNWTIIRPGASGSDVAINNYANSANLVTFTDEGYVGIGETSPGKALHIKGGGWQTAGITLERTDNGVSNDPGITFKSAAGANDAYALGSMWFQNALDGNAYALIRARTDDASGTSGKIEFVTSTGVVGNVTSPAMTIKSNGKIGIGGSSPQQALHIFGGSTDSRMQFTNNTSGNADADGLWVGMDNSQAYILQRENQPLSIYTNATKSWEFHEAGHFIGQLAGKYIQITGSSSHAYAIGVDDNSVTPGTASTSFSISRWNGSDWKNPFRISTAGVVQIRGLSTSSEPQVSGGEVLAVDGPQSYGYESRYVQGIWGPQQASNANTYVHLVTDLWGGGSPHGNTEYIMGGFFVTGYRYSAAANLYDIHQFHNWSATMYSYHKTELGNWTGATHAYVNSSGWVTLRLDSSGSYRNYTVDFVQYGNLYNKRTAKVTAATSSNSATI